MRLFRSISRNDLISIFALLMLPLILFWDVTIGGRTMLPVDNLFQWQPWAHYAAQFGVAQPQNSLLSDLMIQNYAWKQFTVDSIRRGEIPLWNPYILSGQPFLANGQHSMYYPFSLLNFIMPIHAAYGWFTVIQLWLAGSGGWFFGRTLRLRNASSAILGLVYQGGGFMLVSAAVFPMIIAAAVWLPFMLGAIEKIVAGRGQEAGGSEQGGEEADSLHPSSFHLHPSSTLPWVVLGAVSLGLNILAGHPEITYYVLLITGMYAAWRLVGFAIGRRNNRRPSSRPQVAIVRRLLSKSAWLLTMVALGLVLGAIQLVPAFELAGTNFREGGATLAQVRGWAFPLRRVLTLVLPNFFGSPAHHGYQDIMTGEWVSFALNHWGIPNPHGAGSSSWGIKNYVEGGIYLGIVPLVLAAIGLLGWKKTFNNQQNSRTSLTSSFILHPSSFFLFLAFISLNFIFGSPLYAVLFKLPFINQLHSPFRWVFALSIAVAGLAAYGMEAVVGGGGQEAGSRGLGVWSKGIVYLTVLVGAGVLMGSGVMMVAFGRIEPLFDRIMLALAQAPDAFVDGRAFASYLHPQLLAFGVVTMLGGILLLWILRSNFIPHPSSFILLFLLIATDLFLANRGFHVANDPALLDFKPEMAKWLEAQPGQWRLTAFSPKDQAFNANSGWLYNFEDVRGYDSIINRQYTDYMGAIEPQNELSFNRIQPVKDIDALNSPLLDLLNVKYVISSEDISPLPKFEPVWEGEGVRIYENLGVMPRAFTLPTTATFGNDAPLVFPVDRDPRFTAFLDGLDSTSIGGNGDPAEPQAANITVYTNNEIWVDVQVEEDSWLLLNDSYADGWNAFIRPFGADENAEQSLDVIRANGNFRAVNIEEPGAWTVRFRYSPRSFIVGGLTSFLGGIVILFAGAVWGWQRVYRPKTDLTNTQSIAKNSVVPMALNLFNKLIDFAFAMFYLRVLGSADSGKYAAAISIALWFDIVANWGLDALIIRDGAQNKSAIGRYLYNTTILRLLTMVVGLIPVLLFVGEAFLNGDGYPRDVLLALGLIAVGMVFSGIGKGLTGVFYVFESAEYPATLSTITTILKVVFGVAVLLLGWGFVGLAAVSIVTNIITLVLLTALAFRLFPHPRPMDARPTAAGKRLPRWLAADAQPSAGDGVFQD